jgi:urate oxidase
MSIQLGENSYGESGVRLLRVVKQQGRHDVKEMTLNIRFEGDFVEAHAKGENRAILPADTMKNTVYVLARQYPVEAIEEFCLHTPQDRRRRVPRPGADADRRPHHRGPGGRARPRRR